MPKLKIVAIFFCLVAITYCEAGRAGGSSGRAAGSGVRYSRQIRTGISAHSYYNGKEDPYARPPNKPAVKKVRGPGMSGWGIIAITLSIIFLGFAAYYFYLLYPIFCKKERQYNTIELVNV